MESAANIMVERVLLTEAEAIAKANGLPVERVIQEALEHGLVELRSEHFFRSRRGMGDVTNSLAILRRAGAGRSPMPGDEIPSDLR